MTPEELKISVDFNNLWLKSQKRAIEDKLTSYFKKCIDYDEYDDFHSSTKLIIESLKPLKDKTNEIYDVKNGKNPFCFFTVNFKPEFQESDVAELFEVCQSFFSTTTYVKNGQYIWSLEQRSETDETNGYHIHILFEKRDNSPSKIERAFKSKFFDKYVGTVASLDWKYVKESKEKIKYIMGYKADAKMPKVRIDRIMKDRLGLPYYENQGFQDEISKIKEENE